MKGAILGSLCGVFLLPVVAIGAGTGVLDGVSGADSLGAAPSSLPDIPSRVLQLYQAAGQRYGLAWELLAAIGKVECDHGRDPDPSCTHEGAVNYAGAGGPMQFLAGTWATYGVDANHDGRTDRWDPADAIYGAARYLHASGAPADLQRAIYSYNHSSAYVAHVLALMAQYRRDASATPQPPAGGTVALGDARELTRSVLSDRQIRLRPEAALDIRSDRIDPRLLQALLTLGQQFQLDGVGPFITGHSTYVAGSGRISNHAGGRAVDIGTVDGQLVNPINGAARALALAVLSLPAPLRPDEIETPFKDLACVGMRCIVVPDHVHLGYDR